MKHIKHILSLMLAMALMLCASAGAEPQARKMETAADAEEWMTVFLGEHPEELEGVWALTPQMEAAVRQLGGISGLAGQLAALGSVERMDSAREGEIQGLKAFFIPCVFSVMPADLILVVQDGAIAGLSTGAYSGERDTSASEAFDSLDLALPVPALKGELPGILTLPKEEGPFPAVVLIHGSGACDRDEAVGGLKPFRDLAEGLAEKGIAVYRFDKRTYVYGQELSADPQFTLMDESVEDAVNAVQLLARQEKIDPARIFVLGHSQGGNAVPAIDRELKEAPVKACGYIMMAASPRPLEELVREQYDFLYSLLPSITAEQQAEKEALFADLDRLKDLDKLSGEDLIMGARAPYWKWLAAYDILPAAGEITVPVLLLQGEEDYQVTMKDFGIWKNALEGRENWKLISYPGLTHPFTAGLKTEGSAIYSRSDHMDSRVIQDIAGFVLRENNGTESSATAP